MVSKLTLVNMKVITVNTHAIQHSYDNNVFKLVPVEITFHMSLLAIVKPCSVHIALCSM